jgi:hypothetical protein
LGDPHHDAAATDPREVIRVTLQYLRNNQSRMNYPDYRKQGLPVTTAWMESLVKEINWRVKGTEMFRNNPQGAEAILQIRAVSDQRDASVPGDDDRLKRHLQTRPGYPFTRRPKPKIMGHGNPLLAKGLSVGVHAEEGQMPSLTVQIDPIPYTN